MWYAIRIVVIVTAFVRPCVTEEASYVHVRISLWRRCWPQWPTEPPAVVSRRQLKSWFIIYDLRLHDAYIIHIYHSYAYIILNQPFTLHLHQANMNPNQIKNMTSSLMTTNYYAGMKSYFQLFFAFKTEFDTCY